MEELTTLSAVLEAVRARTPDEAWVLAKPTTARFTDVWWKTVTDGSASASDADRFAADIDKLRSL